MVTLTPPLYSALSLRVFSQELTAAGRQATAGRQKKNPKENVASETLIPEMLIPHVDTEGVAEDGAEPNGGVEEEKTALAALPLALGGGAARTV
jgi:hypothetical protein